MAVVASRKVGGAAERNRVRRRAKELFRRNKDKLAIPVDLLLITKKDFVRATWKESEESFFEALGAIKANS
jgi:ribonuclease P protein component